MKAFIGETINGGQIEFNRVCELGGGPARTSATATASMALPTGRLPSTWPFTSTLILGTSALPWGHLAKLDADSPAPLSAGLHEDFVDVHSDVYMLGARHPHSGTWI